jgi:hypothetical protein
MSNLPDLALSELASGIIEEHRLCEQAAVSALEHAKRAG